jgi:hypothetical protein
LWSSVPSLTASDPYSIGVVLDRNAASNVEFCRDVKTHDRGASLEPRGAILDGNLFSHLLCVGYQSIKIVQLVNDY